MRLVCGTHATPDGQRVGEWFGHKVGKFQHPPYSAMGWEDGMGELRACALFNDYNGANLEAHMFGRVTRQALREAFRYAFRQVGVVRVTAKPFLSNVNLCVALERIGFVEEFTMKNYYGLGQHALVMRLDPGAAERWMN